MVISLFSYTKSSVWLVEKEGKKVILAGSVHFPSYLCLKSIYKHLMPLVKWLSRWIDGFNSIRFNCRSIKMAQLFQLQGITIDKTFRPVAWQKFKASMHKYNIPV